jgi:hypothetical protein
MQLNVAECCRSLFGKIEAISYDWLQDSSERLEGAAEAERVRSEYLVAGSVTTLFPKKGNVHAFRALTPAAVFDVLVPGYTAGAPPVREPSLLPSLARLVPNCLLVCPGSRVISMALNSLSADSLQSRYICFDCHSQVCR